jgi:cardiolipin synthase A/B
MWLWILLGVWMAGWVCIPHLLLLNKRPTATLAWIWALLLFPLVGPLLYLMIGSEQIKRMRRERRQGFREGRHASPKHRAGKESKAHPHKEPAAEADDPFLQSLAHITNLPVSTAQELRILRNAPAFYKALRADIENAKTNIHIETYIWRDDEVGRDFMDLLIAAVHRGVTVRVLVDELGSLYLKQSYFRPLIDAGGQFSWCHTLSPLRSRYSFNLRNHRKLQVIDGQVAYIGGMNFGREYLGRDAVDGDWGDIQLRIEGPVVKILQEIFAEDWFFGSGMEDIDEDGKALPAGDHAVQVLRGGPDEEDHPMLRVNLALIARATKRLWIGTGYFVPGEIMQTALQVAAARGVDVRLLVSEKSEHPLLVKAGRSYYDALLRQGIRIYEYRKGIEHSKYVLIDEEFVSVGSSNLDERSMRLNFELSLLMHCPKTNHELAQIFKKTIASATEIDREVFSRRPYGEKLIESAMRVLSPVL